MNTRSSILLTLNDSGEQVRLSGRIATPDEFDAGLSIRHDGSGWLGTAASTIEHMVNDVVCDGPVDAIVLFQGVVGPIASTPRPVFIETTVVGVADGFLLFDDGARVTIMFDVYGVSI